MKLSKKIKIIALILAIMMALAGCEAQYRPEGSNWSFGTDASIYYTPPKHSNWTIKIW